MIKNFTISAALGGARLDEALATVAEITKSEARRIIERGGCAVNQGMVRVASRAVPTGSQLTVGIMQPGEFRELVLDPEAVVYQDHDLLAVAKPSGVASQRTPYQLKGTLEYWVAEEFARQQINEPVRVVHRLDRGTSGLMLFPKHRQAAAWLSELFKHGRIRKRYLALIAGTPVEQHWVSEGAIAKLGSSRWGVMPGGKAALTECRLLKAVEGHALVQAEPRTGRTHQIRVHMAAAGLPIVGDPIYGGPPAGRLMLHCVGLTFDGPTGRKFDLSVLPDEAFVRICGNCWSMPSAV